MKDLPHHMKKLNRRIIRSEHRIESEEEVEEQNPLLVIPVTRPKEQLRKQAKIYMREERESRTPLMATPDERNRLMKNRVPVFDRLSHPRPKQGARPRKRKAI